MNNPTIGDNNTEASSLTWEQCVIKMKLEWLRNQERDSPEFHQHNRKDDISSWLLHTKWSQLFAGKNIRLIGETRLLNSMDQRMLQFQCISKSRLWVLNYAFDCIITWALQSLSFTPRQILTWLKSNSRNQPSVRSFGRLLWIQSESRHINYYKQFIHYCFRTSLLDESIRKQLYGIEFTSDQLRLIQIQYDFHVRHSFILTLDTIG